METDNWPLGKPQGAKAYDLELEQEFPIEAGYVLTFSHKTDGMTQKSFRVQVLAVLPREGGILEQMFICKRLDNDRDGTRLAAFSDRIRDAGFKAGLGPDTLVMTATRANFEIFG